MHTLRPIAVVAAFVCSAAAQTVWSMGAPWTDLAAVVGAAAPGDIVLLNGMTFPPFALNKGLTFVGPGVIRPPVSSSGTTALVIPTTQRAHFLDVDFLPAAVFDWYTHAVTANGVVTFEDCTFGAGVPYSLAVAGTILLERCTFTPATFLNPQTQSAGMQVLGGVCWIANSTLVGGPGHFNSGGNPYVIPPTTALRVEAGTVVIASSTMTGGDGYVDSIFGTPEAGAPALVLVGGDVTLADCMLVGGSSPASLPGATALDAGGGAVSQARTTFLGGAGTPAGPPTTGTVTLVPGLVGLAMPQPFRLGLSAQLIATAGSSQLLGMVAAVDSAAATQTGVSGPFLAAPQLIPVLVAAPLAGGQVVRTINVPNQAALLGAALFAQAFQFDGTILRVSPVVGGTVY